MIGIRTATAVAGNRTIVNTAMDFVAELSFLVSSAMVFIERLSCIVVSAMSLELLASSVFIFPSLRAMKLKSYYYVSGIFPREAE